MAPPNSISLPPLTLVLGGQRSGKSAYAEKRIGDGEAVYVATAQALDGEMSRRIASHKARRGDRWTAVEEPLDIAAALARHDLAGRPVLLDSLGMWVANLLEGQKNVVEETSALLNAVKILTSPLVVVSDQVGLGVIPDNALARRYIDALGTANQAVAALADSVVMVVAGLPLSLK